MSLIRVQYSGYFNKEINSKKELEEELEKERKIEKRVNDEKEEISSLGETDLRQLKEYNLNGHYREEYDTEKTLDFFV